MELKVKLTKESERRMKAMEEEVMRQTRQIQSEMRAMNDELLLRRYCFTGRIDPLKGR